MDRIEYYEYDWYQLGAPSPEAELIDSTIVEGMRCECGSSMVYVPMSKPGSYIALAVCTRPKCGREREF